MNNFSNIEKLDLRGKTVFLRLDLNTPLDSSGKIVDKTRIERALPTIRYILKQTNKVVVASHLGRPKGKVVPSFSLKPVGEELSRLLECQINLSENYIEAPVDQMLKQLDKGSFILLENLRFHEGETSNDRHFAQSLAKGIDIYINDAFGAMHREHASVVALAEMFPAEKKSSGFLVKSEIEALTSLKSKSRAPFTVIIGGSKVSDKVGALLSLIESCNNIVVGGAMAFSFLKFKGFGVGSSLVERGVEGLIESIYNNAAKRKVSIHLPVDHVCAASLVEEENCEVFEGSVPDGLSAFDVGPKTISNIINTINDSKTVFWNGPLGVFEKEAYRRGTVAVAKALGKAECFSVVGGGDSVAAVNLANVGESLDHISTGGGASLEFLEGRTFPGIRALTV